ncbi:MAG: RNA polymerase primary sigma factor [Candidatus Latescibacterota bacterium]|jgi:RNA polymerase primary sigma factor
MSNKAWDSEDAGLQAYFNDIAKSKPLKREQETELANRIKEGDNSARDELAQANLLFVISVAMKYKNRGLSLAELISAGNMGLMTAVDRFDPSRGYKFISYAVWWIRQSILQSLAEDVRTVHLPLNKVTLLHKISRMSQQLSSEEKDEPDLEEIADALDVSIEEVRETVLSGRKAYSLDKEFEEDDERSLMKTLVDASQEAPDANILRTTTQRQLDSVLNSLDKREQRIVRLYFGLDGDEPLTLEQIGAMMDLTRERIRQIKERAFSKLRHPSRYNDLRALEDI